MENADQLYAEVAPQVTRYLRRIFAGSEREDCVQAGLIGAWTGLTRSRGGDPLLIALRWARWQAIRHLSAWYHTHKQRERLVFSASELDIEVEETDLTVDPFPSLLDRLESRQIAREVLALATPRQRQALALRYWDGLTEAECAARLGCSRQNVRTLTSWVFNHYRRRAGLPLAGQAKRAFEGRRSGRRQERREQDAEGTGAAVGHHGGGPALLADGAALHP